MLLKLQYSSVAQAGSNIKLLCSLCCVTCKLNSYQETRVSNLMLVGIPFYFHTGNGTEPFLSALQKVIFFSVRLQIFLHAGCNSLHPMQKMMNLVIRVFKFIQESFVIGIFWHFLYKYLKTFQAKAS